MSAHGTHAEGAQEMSNLDRVLYESVGVGKEDGVHLSSFRARRDLGFCSFCDLFPVP